MTTTFAHSTHLQENPWREFTEVQAVFSETQKEHDEKRFLAKQWW